MPDAGEAKIQMIVIEEINILNPRDRNRNIFSGITDNIIQVGLKRPITVTPTRASNSDKTYNLVCGQGRIEAFLEHKQEKIPAIVINVSERKAMIMSLVENLARRRPRPVDLMKGIEVLTQKGYDKKKIAEKTGLKVTYVGVILKLLRDGEERLLAAVEAGHVPVSVAVSISKCPADQQAALQKAYDNNELRGSKLKAARRLLDKRKRLGASFGEERSRRKATRAKTETSATNDVLKIYQNEVERKRLLTRRANIVNERLVSTLEALRILSRQGQFRTILKREGLETMPKPLQILMESKHWP